jgi:uncharacterized membrane protein YcjF (UPF0283 family)
MIEILYCTAAAIVGAASVRWPRHAWRVTKWIGIGALVVVFSPLLILAAIGG